MVRKDRWEPNQNDTSLYLPHEDENQGCMFGGLSVVQLKQLRQISFLRMFWHQWNFAIFLASDILPGKRNKLILVPILQK